jgi:hypothetical protein
MIQWSAIGLHFVVGLLGTGETILSNILTWSLAHE